MKIPLLGTINIVLFLAMLFVNSKLGAFLLIYLLVGLIFLAPHALLWLAGVILLFMGISQVDRSAIKVKRYTWVGSLCLFAGLVVFFLSDAGRENYPTFRNTWSLISIAAFVLTNLYLNYKVTVLKPPSQQTGEGPVATHPSQPSE